MTETTGTLYGIGVGPGDPDMITLKAVKILNQVDVVYAAASTKNDYSLAVSIARPHIPETAELTMLRFPMTTDREETRKAWKNNARMIIDTLEQGKNAAFLTLGDSMTYSTYGYLLQNIQELAPSLNVVSVPGITSYQASAACLNTPLVEGEESLVILSGAQGGDRLRQFSGIPENVVFLKAYKNVGDITDALEEADMLDRSVCVTHCCQKDQEIIHDIRQLGNRPPDYWTLIMAKRKKVNHGSR